MRLKVKKTHPQARIPKYATDGSACFDLHALIGDGASISVKKDLSVVIHTGLSFEIPPGQVMLVFSRSGHGFKQNVRLANCTGVIDSDYRGEVMVKLTRDEGIVDDFIINDGDRIAQAMILSLPFVTIEETQELSSTSRGAGGFGSTGI